MSRPQSPSSTPRANGGDAPTPPKTWLNSLATLLANSRAGRHARYHAASAVVDGANHIAKRLADLAETLHPKR